VATNNAAREMTHEEWAAKLIEDGALTPKHLAIVLGHAEQRGREKERRECADMLREHALTINEVSLSHTPLDRILPDFQTKIDVAHAIRHAVEYASAIVSRKQM
jgi:hypothetical protein